MKKRSNRDIPDFSKKPKTPTPPVPPDGQHPHTPPPPVARVPVVKPPATSAKSGRRGQ